VRNLDYQLSNLRNCVNKLRLIADGKLLLFLARRKQESTQEMKESIEKAIGDESDDRVLTKDSEMVVEMSDLNALSMKPDIISPLAKQCGKAKDMIVVRSIRPASGDLQTALDRLPRMLAKLDLSRLDCVSYKAQRRDSRVLHMPRTRALRIQVQ